MHPDIMPPMYNQNTDIMPPPLTNVLSLSEYTVISALRKCHSATQSSNGTKPPSYPLKYCEVISSAGWKTFVTVAGVQKGMSTLKRQAGQVTRSLHVGVDSLTGLAEAVTWLTKWAFNQRQSTPYMFLTLWP